MNTYVVTMLGVRGEIIVEADGFYTRGEGDLVFYRNGEPVSEREPDDPPGLPPYTYRPKISILAYADGTWRSVMDRTAKVEYTYPTRKDAPSENSQRRQKT